MRLKLYRITAFAATSLACVFISCGVSVSAQEAEAEATTIETTIDSEAVPGDAKTTENLAIEIDDLELLAKPLTLEELQNESAAWLLLLKNKVQELSYAEIIVKYQNRKLDAQKESMQLLEDAKTELLAAEQAQSQATPDTSEYQEATKQLGAARGELRTAAASVDQLLVTESELQENGTLQESLKQGRKERGIKEAKEILETAKEVRRNMASDSPQYQVVIQGIRDLQGSLNNFEKAEADLDSTIPNSAEYDIAKAESEAARETVKKSRSQLMTIMSGLTGPAIADVEFPTENLAQKSAKIEAEFAEAASSFENKVENLNQLTAQEVVPQIDQVTSALNKKLEKEEALKTQLVVNVTDLEAERNAIINRFIAVLDALDNKGGDSASYRKYIENVSVVDLDLTDTQGIGVRVVRWLTSPDGGLNLLLNIIKFGGILIVSVLIAPQAGKISGNLLNRVGGMSTLFRGFIVMIIKRGVVVLGFLLGLAALGVNLGPILALIGGASFILAFALQSNLANFASGLMLLINKPFDVGDEIKVAGYWAYVDSISIASTKIKDFGGNIITLPNNTVWGSDIINYTHADVRKLGLAIHVKFEQDLEKIYKMWMDITAAHPKVLDEPAPSWFPWNGHYDYYIYVNLTAWSKTDDYWYVYVDLLKELQKQVQELGIELTAPQQEIKLDKLLPKTLATQQPLLK
ncbi:small-conductance mechanosensitive channel [Xenococcus sp. PCC 7305]|uniref:mechanosensitive ion channel family protein n=1 Tax=Xenococcus sp. PCC 7305 TaxID=102125 RepID=UPI0002ACA279|nr:mechanosensitive ion channel family protein [Xenococcus sp. PCC 7305]ELS01226.1 small-conductance mechanosensitive channel [Xenococcus sp. PCC 7305]